VAAEVVVILEQQDPCVRIELAGEEGGRQTAHAGPDHHEVVRARIGIRGRPPIAAFLKRHLVGDLEGAGVGAAQAEPRRRVGLRRRRRARHAGPPTAGRQQGARPDGRARHGHCAALQEVAPRDRAVHAELAIARVHARRLSSK